MLYRVSITGCTGAASADTFRGVGGGVVGSHLPAGKGRKAWKRRGQPGVPALALVTEPGSRKGPGQLEQAEGRKARRRR